jgi:hypothetical protein
MSNLSSTGSLPNQIYALEPCTATPSSIHAIFDVTELDRYLINTGILRVFDTRRDGYQY